MLKSVSNVSFGQTTASKPVDLNAPQKYPRPDASVPQAEPKKKSNKFLKAVAGLVVAAAVVTGAMVAGNKLGWFDKLAQSAGKNWIKNSAEWLNNSGEKIAEFGMNCFNKVKGLFSKAPQVNEEGQRLLGTGENPLLLPPTAGPNCPHA